MHISNVLFYIIRITIIKVADIFANLYSVLAGREGNGSCQFIIVSVNTRFFTSFRIRIILSQLCR